MKSLSRARLFATPWVVACTKLLRPWDFQGKSTGVGCHFLLQGIFPTQGSNPGLSHCRQTLTVWATREIQSVPLFNLSPVKLPVSRSVVVVSGSRFFTLSPFSHTFKSKAPNVVCCCLVLSHVQLFCNSMDCSFPGFSVRGILQARILEWVAIPFFRGSSQPRDWTLVSCLAGRFFITEPPGNTKTPRVPLISFLFSVHIFA